MDYLGYPLDPCFKRRNIGIRTKDLYEYAMYIYIYYWNRDFCQALSDADLYSCKFLVIFISEIKLYSLKINKFLIISINVYNKFFI